MKLNRYFRRLLAPLALLAVLGLAAPGCIIATEEDSTLTVENVSDYPLYELYVAPVSAPTWGPDLLGNDILLPNESITIFVDCGTYDALVIDDIGASCELYNLDLCFDDALWVIDNATLATCNF